MCPTYDSTPTDADFRGWGGGVLIWLRLSGDVEIKALEIDQLFI